MSLYRTVVKRSADRLVALIALGVLSPLLLVLWILVAVRMGRPVLFRQTRIGKNNASFTFFKFRSMTDARDSAGRLLSDDERLTAFGKFLRASSLDELPQLFNVVKGDMSLIGPRPLLPEYLPRYSAEQIRRHEVHPGITGWAQVNGRNAISWDEKFRLDVWYVDHISFGLDMEIGLRTVMSVVRRRGISEAGQATVTAFMGPAGTHEGDEAERT